LLDLLEFAAERSHLFGSKAFTEFFSEQSEGDGEGGDGGSAGFLPSDEEETTATGGHRSLSPSEAAEVAYLGAKGQYMEASARTVHLDPTPALSPTPSSMAATPTPAEEMLDLPDYLSVAAEDVSAAVRLELEDDLEGSVER